MRDIHVHAKGNTMRYLLFSDIHGNFQAVNAILLKHAAESFDGIYCLGDIVSGGANGDQVIALLENHQVQSLMGNHDEFMLFPKKGLFPDWAEDYVFDLLAWEQEYLSQHSWNYLKSLPETLMIQLEDNTETLLCHSTPTSRWDLAPLSVSASEETMNLHYAQTTASVIVHGHDHLGTGVRQWRDKQIINIASVGGRSDGLACYTIIESTPFQYQITQCHVVYDWEQEKQQMMGLNVPLLENYRHEA